MPRRRMLQEESLKLWVRGLLTWKRCTLEIVLEERPITTGDMLNWLLQEGHETMLVELYNFLSKLERKGLVKSLKVFMTDKRAWGLTDAREQLRGALAG